MRISLLTTDSDLATWFSKTYPHVKVCCKVNDAFFEAECMILTSHYKVGEDYVEILSIWDKFLRIRHAGKKLIILGWSKFLSSNYLQVGAMPETLDRDWSQKVKRAGNNYDPPVYPPVPDRDLLPILVKVIHSHGERPFKKLLHQAQAFLRRIEQAISEGESIEKILAMEQMAEVESLITRINGVWHDREAYFALTPFYPKLKAITSILSSWEELKQTGRPVLPSLSQQLMKYHTILHEMVRFYKIEKKS